MARQEATVKLLLICNLAARSGKLGGQMPRIRRWIASCSHRVSIVELDSKEIMRSEILSASGRGFEGVILAGGDGTIHSALPAILEASIPFGVLPMGRGNDFVRNIGGRVTPFPSGDVLNFTGKRSIDIPTVNGVPFGSIACVGFDALANEMALNHEGYFDGTVGYVICVLKALSRFTPFEIELAVDDYSWRGSVTMVAVANGRYYGGGMQISPPALMDDGLLTVCVVGALTPLRLLMQFPKVFSGRHISHPSVSILHSRTVRITSSSERSVYADGEYCGSLPVECAVKFRNVQVLC